MSNLMCVCVTHANSPHCKMHHCFLASDDNREDPLYPIIHVTSLLEGG